MQELKRIDYVKLEDYIENIDKYRTDLKFREYELLSNHEPDNPEGGKANIVNSPIEQQVVKCQQDPRYRRLSDIVHGVDMFLVNVTNKQSRYLDSNTGRSLSIVIRGTLSQTDTTPKKSSMLNYKSKITKKISR